jgi:hypothetical protein
MSPTSETSTLVALEYKCIVHSWAKICQRFAKGKRRQYFLQFVKDVNAF